MRRGIPTGTIPHKGQKEMEKDLGKVKDKERASQLTLIMSLLEKLTQFLEAHMLGENPEMTKENC